MTGMLNATKQRTKRWQSSNLSTWNVITRGCKSGSPIDMSVPNDGHTQGNRSKDKAVAFNKTCRRKHDQEITGSKLSDYSRDCTWSRGSHSYYKTRISLHKMSRWTHSHRQLTRYHQSQGTRFQIHNEPEEGPKVSLRREGYHFRQKLRGNHYSSACFSNTSHRKSFEETIVHLLALAIPRTGKASGKPLFICLQLQYLAPGGLDQDDSIGFSNHASVYWQPLHSTNSQHIFQPLDFHSRPHGPIPHRQNPYPQSSL